MALIRDGEVVHFVHRHQIEGRSPQSIAADLTKAFDTHCNHSVGA
jgi:putative YphP/YqiW family bacilliredoxin